MEQQDYERQAELGDVPPTFNIIHCLKRQLDSRMCDEANVIAALDAHVYAGRLTIPEAELALADWMVYGRSKQP